MDKTFRASCHECGNQDHVELTSSSPYLMPDGAIVGRTKYIIVDEARGVHGQCLKCRRTQWFVRPAIAKEASG